MGKNKVFLANRSLYGLRVLYEYEGESGLFYLDAGPSQKLKNHSPNGFNWGYHGSGPSQLALALLLDVVGRAKALKHYQEFKRWHVACFSDDEWAMSAKDIKFFVEERERRHD